MKKQIKIVTTAWLIGLMAAFGGWQVATAQDATPTPEGDVIVVPPEPTVEVTLEPTPVPTPDQPPVVVIPPVTETPNRLSDLLAVIIAFALYCLSLAGAVQVAVNQIKPLFIDPFKDKLTADQYTVTIYVVRTVITSLAYFFAWGGVVATRLVVPSIPMVIPDVGVAVVTILLVVLGEEVLHPLIEKLYTLRDATRLLDAVQVNVKPNDTEINAKVKAEVSSQLARAIDLTMRNGAN